MATPHARLLIVDDEEAQMHALCDTLRDEDYAATGFTTAGKALAALQEQEFDLILTDLQMPDMDGIALLRKALEIDRHLVGIVMTGHGAIDTAVEAMKAGAIDYILKPFKLSAVLPVLSRALALRNLRMENIQLREAVSIYELSSAIAFAREVDTVVEELANAAFRQSDSGTVTVLLPSPDETELTIWAARGTNAGRIRGKTVEVSGPLREWLDEWRRNYSRPSEEDRARLPFEHPLREVTTGVALPMFAGGKLMGVLTFTSLYPRRVMAKGQVKALHILANAAASALAGAQFLRQLRAVNADLERRVVERTRELHEKNRQIEEELKMARELQLAMLPHGFPSIPRGASPSQSALRFYTVYHPAGSVSGDFFDVLSLNDSSIGVFICDVMGHDVRAALVTTMMRALVQELSATMNEPGELLSEVNRQFAIILKHADPMMFATASYLIVNPDRSEVRYANAGHPAPIHVQRGRGEVRPICNPKESGPALGLFDGATYQTWSSQLAAGDCLMLFTDGLFEVEAENDELYSQEKLREAISRQIKLPAEELLNKLFAEIRQFSGRPQFEDDVCMVAVEVTRVNGQEPNLQLRDIQGKDGRTILERTR